MPQWIATVATLVFLLAALLVVHLARRESSAIRRETIEETAAMREDARDMLAEAQRREERVATRERELSADQREAQTHARTLEERAADVAREERRLASEREELKREHQRALAEAADTTVDEAYAALRDGLIDEVRENAQRDARALEKRIKATSESRSKEILVAAMQRQAAATTAETTTTWIELPSEEMKGRIIGREGRNIRAFESLTGVNILVEDGVTAVQLSSFDVERREIAEVTLRALIEDGRIQPQRVEAAYAQARDDAHRRHEEAGLDAIETAGVRGVPLELASVLGSLRLRTSYGQNVLAHLVESAQIAAEIARDVGADVDLARRAAFLHDIGKAFTHEREGTHAAIGARLARDHGESEAVVNAIAAHHDEVDQQTLEAVIVQVADAISASRPGARREDLDGYVDRMVNIERLVLEHAGVAKALAMAAGREVRVIVEPDDVDDEGARALARTIAGHISSDLSVPGEIKVTVIREFRADAVSG